jgi:hypothetical protein
MRTVLIRIGLMSALGLVAGCYADYPYPYYAHPYPYGYGYGYAGGYYRYDDGRYYRGQEHERHEQHEQQEQYEHRHF